MRTSFWHYRICRSALFLLLILSPVLLLGNGAQSEPQKAKGLIDYVKTNLRYVGNFESTQISELPLGIKRNVGNQEYVIVIDSAVYTPTGVTVSVYAALQLGISKDKSLIFGAKGIKLGYNGIADQDYNRLVLLSSDTLVINSMVSLIIPGNARNYVDWDCKGFKSVNLFGEFEFSSSTFEPDPEFTSDLKVKASFECNVSDLNNVLISTSITPFRLKGMDGFTFEVKEASVDMSDDANPHGFVAPAGYFSGMAGLETLWRGFFFKLVKVTLPQEISQSGKRTSIGAQNMLVDDNGFTGSFFADYPFGTEKGSLSGWPFSISNLSVMVEKNRLKGGSLAGTLNIPFLGKDTVGYMATLEATPSGLNYLFGVQLDVDKEFSMPLGGKLYLGKACTFIVSKDEKGLVPKVVLNGYLKVDAKPVEFEKIKFESLTLTAKSPYIVGGYFGYDGGFKQSIGGFSLTINSLGVSTFDGQIALSAKVGIELGGDTPMLKGEAGITVKAAYEKKGDSGDREWKFKGVSVSEIAIAGNFSIFSLKGRLAIYDDDPIYGNGFKGNAGFSMSAIPCKLDANVLFGRKGQTKYWYARVDASVVIQVGMVKIVKLSGGAYCNAKRIQLDDNKYDYIPDTTGSMGFIAGLGVEIPQKNVFYGEGEMDISFSKNWGLRQIQMLGNGNFFTAGEAPYVWANFNTVYNSDEKIFHANLKTYMNIYGAIRGSGPGNLVGEAVIHSDPKDWYIYIGRPSAMNSIEMYKLATAKSYFMTGTKVEDMPLPPSRLGKILGDIDLNFMKKENAVSTGKGIGFGARMELDFGFGKNGGFAYAYLTAGAGADILLRDYGNVTCEGRSGPMGISGWYASGQAYAYMEGKVGIRARHREFDIMAMSAGVLLQAKGPNPFWLKGKIAAKYSVLGGLVRGKVNIPVLLGEECEMVTNGRELGEIKLIGDITPASGANDIDVFTAPQVAFNTAIDKEFGMINLNDEYQTYRVKLDELKIVDKGAEVSATYSFSRDKDLATLKPHDILPGNTNLKLLTKIHIEKKEQSGWQALMYQGQVDYEVKETAFTTGDEPKSIPASNVAYSYPVDRQFNFFKSEYGEGYVKLKSGQPKLFATVQNGAKWRVVGKMSNSVSSIEVPVTYNADQSLVRFTIPASLSTSSAWNFSIVRIPEAQANDQNISKGAEQLAVANDGDTTTLAKNKLTGAGVSSAEAEIFALNFRTSKYARFLDKLNAMGSAEEQYNVEGSSKMSLLGLQMRTEESLDQYEMVGAEGQFEPLVYAEALMNNRWLTEHVDPTVYGSYQQGDNSISLSRDITKLGLRPLKAMLTGNLYGTQYLMEESDKGQAYVPSKPGDFIVRYYVPHFVYQDFFELRNKALEKYYGRTSALPRNAALLIHGDIHDIDPGRYGLKVNYRLPGLGIVTSSKEYSINFLSE
ncbi:hypothetical protein [Williamwhitmania taraxaci]|uniref:Uncharacterized protein n=1 Tax=Williamwhitmania taraxaci TaxID=1640674 RepID=A0A1G6RSF2_9BACT|nr:hypothetical protein [Williamwhitmania taraxaci]SDD07630.1 hypothetical protein SAMN05216323_10803 [Williamwhitmania taraxaci]